MPSEDDVPPCCPVEDCTQEDGHEQVLTCGRVTSSHPPHRIHSSDACDSCGYCEERCRDNGECVDCNNCDSRILTNDWCSECECCDDCCECVSCGRCGQRFPNSDAVCPDCDRCRDRCGCTCEEAAPPPPPNEAVFVEGPDNPKFWASTKKGFVTNPVRRMVACEIEVADCSPDVYGRLKAVAHNWGASIVYDGSLPGNTGFEINTAPANGNQFEAQLREWTTELHEGRAKVNEQCGLHVHVDARDVLKDDLMKVIALYYRVETDLFGLVAPSRATNGTCLPCARDCKLFVDTYKNPRRHLPPNGSPNWRQMLFSKLYDVSASQEALRNCLPREKRQRRPGARYRALNLHSYFYRKTFEFRLHHGTTQYAKIRNWSLLCASFVDRAVASNWTQIQQWPNGIAGLLKLAPDFQSKQWVKERWAVFNPEKQIDDDGCRLEYAEV